MPTILKPQAIPWHEYRRTGIRSNRRGRTRRSRKKRSKSSRRAKTKRSKRTWRRSRRSERKVRREEKKAEEGREKGGGGGGGAKRLPVGEREGWRKAGARDERGCEAGAISYLFYFPPRIFLGFILSFCGLYIYSIASWQQEHSCRTMFHGVSISPMASTPYFRHVSVF